jgi:hypothetical protein
MTSGQALPHGSVRIGRCAETPYSSGVRAVRLTLSAPEKLCSASRWCPGGFALLMAGGNGTNVYGLTKLSGKVHLLLVQGFRWVRLDDQVHRTVRPKWAIWGCPALTDRAGGSVRRPA